MKVALLSLAMLTASIASAQYVHIETVEVTTYEYSKMLDLSTNFSNESTTYHFNASTSLMTKQVVGSTVPAPWTANYTPLGEAYTPISWDHEGTLPPNCAAVVMSVYSILDGEQNFNGLFI